MLDAVVGHSIINLILTHQKVVGRLPYLPQCMVVTPLRTKLILSQIFLFALSTLIIQM